MAGEHHAQTLPRRPNPKIGARATVDLIRLLDFVRQQDPALDEPGAKAKLALALGCDARRWPHHALRVLSRGRLLVTLQRSRPAQESRERAAAIELRQRMTKAQSDYALLRWCWFVGRLAAVGVPIDRRDTTRHLSRSAALVRANRERALSAALLQLKPGASPEVRRAVLAAKLALHETDAQPNRASLAALERQLLSESDFSLACDKSVRTPCVSCASPSRRAT